MLDGASKATLENEFGTSNEDECIIKILENGEVQKSQVRNHLILQNLVLTKLTQLYIEQRAWRKPQRFQGAYGWTWPEFLRQRTWQEWTKVWTQPASKSIHIHKLVHSTGSAVGMMAGSTTITMMTH